MAEGLRTGAHELYFTRLLEGELHPAFQGLDANRMTVAYFAITALDVLGALERCRTRDAIVEWILAQQVLPRCARCAGGFRGGSSSGAPFCAGGAFPTHAFDGPHLASTYTALASLLALGDDLARVRRDAVLRGVRALQQPDGSFCAFAGGESDMRFVFCAAAVGTMLGDGDGDGDGGGGGGGGGGDGAWACLDRPSAIAYIPEGGIGLGPGQEAHGGSTFCALAALHLLGALGTLDRPDLAARWCAERQLRGFQGRANKDEDTCYSYWLGASLALLGHAELVAVRAPPGTRARCGAVRRCVARRPCPPAPARCAVHRRCASARNSRAAASRSTAGCASTRARRPTRCTRVSRCAA